ncbi:tripartite tricarboxylate transporter TctB family protein [Rhodoplanes serenus]|uniref:tripartite tricarboxylate transporter TctB family protein n=1 Tax=Rhodoplanes serenus TaxID=200615 RepID=UPI000DAC5F19|nr:tripartite tricarboxylate transporter TctB family protein [Rhodoplanes serenus]RAI35832.1 hypothetical protein CH340_04745 [Rhodoplanes serenus]
MTDRSGVLVPRPWRRLLHLDVLAGLMFILVAGLGLWVSRDYPVGTALRMGTGYMPRLLCWLLLGLGAVIALRGLRDPHGVGDGPIQGTAWRPAILVATALVVFGLALERLGLIVAILLLIGLGALAGRNLRPAETVVAAAVLVALAWAVFIAGLGLTIPVWPEW